MHPPASSPSPTAPAPGNLVNAAPHSVTYVDGRTETIPLARLSIRQLYAFAKHLGEAEGPELVMLCTGRAAEWVDTLAPASFGALHKACIDLNFPAATEVAKGDPRLAARLMPFIQDSATTLILAMGAMVGLNSNASSPAPAPSVSPAATGSESSTTPPAVSSPSSVSASG